MSLHVQFTDPIESGNCHKYLLIFVMEDDLYAIGNRDVKCLCRCMFKRNYIVEKKGDAHSQHLTKIRVTNFSFCSISNDV